MRRFSLPFLAATLYLLPTRILAADIIPDPNSPGSHGDSTQQRLPGSNGLDNPGEVNTGINNLVTTILHDLFFALGAVALLMLIYSGIQYILAAGQPDAAKKARQNVFNTVLGIILLTSAYAIVELAISIGAYFTS